MPQYNYNTVANRPNYAKRAFKKGAQDVAGGLESFGRAALNMPCRAPVPYEIQNAKGVTLDSGECLAGTTGLQVRIHAEHGRYAWVYAFRTPEITATGATIFKLSREFSPMHYTLRK